MFHSSLETPFPKDHVITKKSRQQTDKDTISIKFEFLFDFIAINGGISGKITEAGQIRKR